MTEATWHTHTQVELYPPQMSCVEVLNQDFKTFKVEDKNIGISQVMTMDFDEIEKDKDKYIELLNKLHDESNYSVVTLFVTDIIKNGSYVFYNNKAEYIVSEAYNIDNLYQGIYIDGLVSRKKQMLPDLLECIERRNS